jgi:hypothetical protein
MIDESAALAFFPSVLVEPVHPSFDGGVVSPCADDLGL